MSACQINTKAMGGGTGGGGGGAYSVKGQASE